MSNYVYIESQRWQDENYYTHVLYTVGFYAPDGKFIPESDHNAADAAAARAAYLNGSPAVRLCERLVDPDDLGYAVEPEVRQEAYKVLQGVGLRPQSTNK